MATMTAPIPTTKAGEPRVLNPSDQHRLESTPPMTTKRKPTRKSLTMLVTVSVPINMTVWQARKEVKCLVTEQCNWMADQEDVKALAVKSFKAR